MNTSPRYVAGYARISGDEAQVVSIARQQSELLKTADDNGTPITPEYMFVDVGKSGGTLKRHAMQKLLALILSNQVSRLYAYELSRLSRSVKDTEYLLELFVEHKVELILLYGFVDTSTPEGAFAMGMQAQLAQYWRKRTSFAMKRYWSSVRATEGYHSHRPPLGLERSGHAPHVEWRTNRDFELVLEIIDLYLKGHGSPTITRTLNAKGRTWKTGKTLRKPLIPDSVHNIIQCIERYQQFLDPVTFALVCQTREERRARLGNHRVMLYPPALLRSLVRCAVCGTRFYSSHHPHNGGKSEWTYGHPNFIHCANPRKTISRLDLDPQGWALANKVMQRLATPNELLLPPPPKPVRDLQKERRELEEQLKSYARMLSKNQIADLEYDALRSETLAALKQIETELNTPVPASMDSALLREIALNLYEVVGRHADLVPHEANRLMRLLFESLPVYGTELQAPVLNPALGFTLDSDE